MAPQERKQPPSAFVARRPSVADSETTPLLRGTTAQAASAASAPPAKGVDKPLPKKQIMLLCYARLIEPIAFFSIFPYVNQMVQVNGQLEDADVGFYSGLIESLFSLTQMMVMMFWGSAADRWGRKPVLVYSLFGVSMTTALFGFAKTIWQMILFRCLSGIFAGTIVTIRTMITEHSTSKTQARAFSLFAFSGNLGIFLGPLIGGALADPVGQYSWIGHNKFLETYPYVLSSLVVGVVGLTAATSSALWIEETLPPKPKRRGGADGDEEAGPDEPQKSTWEILKTPGVATVLTTYGYVMVLAFAYTAILPVFQFSPIELGGFGFSPLQISLFMGLTGASQAFWLLFIFPPLQWRYGTNGVLRFCGRGYPFFLMTMPCLSLVLRQGTEAATTAFWVLAPIFLISGSGIAMAFTAVQLALNDVSPSPESLGMLNALALTGMSGLRSCTPAIFSSLFAVSVKYQLVGGYLVWIVVIVLSCGFTILTRYLPDASEKPPADEDDTPSDTDTLTDE